MLGKGGEIGGHEIPGLNTAHDGLAKAKEGITAVRTGIKQLGLEALVAKFKDGLASLK